MPCALQQGERGNPRQWPLTLTPRPVSKCPFPPDQVAEPAGPLKTAQHPSPLWKAGTISSLGIGWGFSSAKGQRWHQGSCQGSGWQHTECCRFIALCSAATKQCRGLALAGMPTRHAQQSLSAPPQPHAPCSSVMSLPPPTSNPDPSTPWQAGSLLLPLGPYSWALASCFQARLPTRDRGSLQPACASSSPWFLAQCSTRCPLQAFCRPEAWVDCQCCLPPGCPCRCDFQPVLSDLPSMAFGAS